jgi:transcriptional regulator with XRE-family HTH domain
LVTKFRKEERAGIKQEAVQEARMLLAVQNFIASSVEEYMIANKVGFNQLVEKLGSSPSYLSKIRKGQANLTTGSFAHLMATLGKNVEPLFKIKK